MHYTPYSKGDVQSRNAGARRSLSESVTAVRRHAPVDAEVGIVPQHAAVAGGVVGVVDLVDDLRVGRQRDEAVQEAARHEDLRAVLGRDLLGDPPPVGRRAAARVDGDVEDRAPHHPHQLGLREGRRLVVQAAQRALLRRQALVVLDEGEVEPASAIRAALQVSLK